MLDDADSYHGSGNAGDELRTLGVVKKNELLTSAAASHCGRFILEAPPPILETIHFSAAPSAETIRSPGRRLWRRRPMDENEDPLELERKIAQASRISSRITDQTTYERLRAWAEELRQRLGQRLAARRTREEIKARAHELWEQNGRPADRDLEFWLQAEAEMTECHRK